MAHAFCASLPDESHHQPITRNRGTHLKLRGGGEGDPGFFLSSTKKNIKPRRWRWGLRALVEGSAYSLFATCGRLRRGECERRVDVHQLAPAAARRPRCGRGDLEPARRDRHAPLLAPTRRRRHREMMMMTMRERRSDTHSPPFPRAIALVRGTRTLSWRRR